MTRKFTFLKWADSLSKGARGNGKVIVPPLYATLYGSRTIFVRDEDRNNNPWDEFSRALTLSTPKC